MVFSVDVDHWLLRVAHGEPVGRPWLLDSLACAWVPERCVRVGRNCERLSGLSGIGPGTPAVGRGLLGVELDNRVCSQGLDRTGLALIRFQDSAVSSELQARNVMSQRCREGR